MVMTRYKTTSHQLLKIKKLYETALHWAAKRNFDDVAQILIENGADVDAKDIVRQTLTEVLRSSLGRKDTTLFCNKAQ